MRIEKRRVIQFAALVIAAFIVMQIAVLTIPKLRPSNPPIYTEMTWDSEQTEALWDRACNDCHSNETIWPWYSRIFPIAVLIVHDVNEGRDEFNISDFDRLDVDEMIEVIEEGEMPPAVYVPLHPEAKLTAEEQEQLIQGIINTFGIYDLDD